MFRSIRWTLLGGYALILAAVIGGSTWLLFDSIRGQMRAAIAATLAGDAQIIRSGLRSGPGGTFDLALPDVMARQYQKAGSDRYYVIWDAHFGVADRSDPRVNPPPTGVPGLRENGDFLELVTQGPEGLRILVGVSLVDANGFLQTVLRRFVLIGGAILLIAMTGGALLANRVLSPISRMSRTASVISGSNLSARIDVSKTASELGQLAATLNGAFARLEEAFERQRRFTTDASHELRTPLATLTAHAELALNRERSPEEYRETLQTCLKAAQRMTGLVEGLLTLARADAGQLGLRQDRVDMAALVEEVVKGLRPLADPRKIALQASLDAVSVQGDEEHLRRVVINLLSNAIRYNRDGGQVAIRLARNGHDAILEIADTGAGIPEEDQAHLFERFYRADTNRSRDFGGSGLGLAISRSLVDAHGGSIAFQSRSGTGTTFIVRLPLERRPS